MNGLSSTLGYQYVRAHVEDLLEFIVEEFDFDAILFVPLRYLLWLCKIYIYTHHTILINLVLHLPTSDLKYFSIKLFWGVFKSLRSWSHSNSQRLVVKIHVLECIIKMCLIFMSELNFEEAECSNSYNFSDYLFLYFFYGIWETRIIVWVIGIIFIWDNDTYERWFVFVSFLIVIWRTRRIIWVVLVCKTLISKKVSLTYGSIKIPNLNLNKIWAMKFIA